MFLPRNARARTPAFAPFVEGRSVKGARKAIGRSFLIRPERRDSLQAGRYCNLEGMSLRTVRAIHNAVRDDIADLVTPFPVPRPRRISTLRSTDKLSLAASAQARPDRRWQLRRQVS